MSVSDTMARLTGPMPNVLPDKEALFRSLFDAFTNGDQDTFRALVHEDLEIAPTEHWAPPGTTYHGEAGLLALISAPEPVFPGLEVTVHESRDLGAWLLVRMTIHVPPRDGQPSSTHDATWIYYFEDGRLRRALGFNTEAEALEAAERPTPEEFQVAFHHAPRSIMLLDDEGRFREVNLGASKFFGADSASLRGRPLTDFVPKARLPSFRSLWGAFIDGAPMAADSTLCDGAGTSHAVELRGKSNYIPGRHLLVFTLRDGEPGSHSRMSTLTPREREVFQLLALGFSGREIADRLVLSPDTVRTHVQNGIGRLGAKTRAQAIALALTRGEISL
jgi:PAS domain S-box-containing protein